MPMCARQTADQTPSMRQAEDHNLLVRSAILALVARGLDVCLFGLRLLSTVLGGRLLGRCSRPGWDMCHLVAVCCKFTVDVRNGLHDGVPLLQRERDALGARSAGGSYTSRYAAAYLLAGFQVASAVLVVLANTDHGLAPELAHDNSSSCSNLKPVSMSTV